MPTYQYACKSCGHSFEIVQSFSDASLTQCPECSGDLRKVFSSVGVVFKGSGFYRNDSRSGSSSSIPSGSSGESSSSSSSGESSAGSSGESSAGSSGESSSSSGGGSKSTGSTDKSSAPAASA